MQGIPDSKKILLLKSEILGFGIRNTAKGIWNLSNNWNSESKFHWQKNPESSIPGFCGMESRVQVYQFESCGGLTISSLSQSSVTWWLSHLSHSFADPYLPSKLTVKNVCLARGGEESGGLTWTLEKKTLKKQVTNKDFVLVVWKKRRTNP